MNARSNRFMGLAMLAGILVSTGGFSPSSAADRFPSLPTPPQPPPSAEELALKQAHREAMSRQYARECAERQERAERQAVEAHLARIAATPAMAAAEAKRERKRLKRLA